MTSRAVKFGWCWLGASVVLPFSRATDDAAMRASAPAVRTQITAAINGQLEAFRRGDTPGAYAFNGALLQGEVSVTGFERMVKKNYPEIWRSARAEFGIIRDNGERGTVLVHVYAANSDAPYDYFLRYESDSWKIVGVLRHDPNGSDRL